MPLHIKKIKEHGNDVNKTNDKLNKNPKEKN